MTPDGGSHGDGHTIERMDGGIATLTLDRPERLNALSWQLIADLHEAFDRIGTDESIRLLLITGAGRGFCSGLDISAADPLGSGDGVVKILERQELVANLAVKLRKLPIPVIAAVNGPATGAGLALALAADVRLCAPEAKFSAAFVRLGISACDIGVSYMLPRIVGHGVASEMMLTGNLVDAAQAYRVGLVNRVVEGERLLESATDFGRDMIRNSPFALRMTKQVLALSLDADSIEAAVEMENRTQVLATQTRDVHEAVAAFKEKRAADFEGRSRTHRAGASLLVVFYKSRPSWTGLVVGID